MAQAVATKSPPPSWRSLYPVHPCADVFPMMSEAELEALAADIKARGLQKPVTMHYLSKQKIWVVLDGRNRLEALDRLGWVPADMWTDVTRGDQPMEIFEKNTQHDPAAYVISANIHRRHLSKLERAELIVKTVEAEQTNDQAKAARSFSPTVGKKGGSTKDPILEKAVTEAAKQQISRRTVKKARAKVHGKQAAPRKPRNQKLPELAGTKSKASAPITPTPPAPPAPDSTPGLVHYKELPRLVETFFTNINVLIGNVQYLWESGATAETTQLKALIRDVHGRMKATQQEITRHRLHLEPARKAAGKAH